MRSRKTILLVIVLFAIIIFAMSMSSYDRANFQSSSLIETSVTYSNETQEGNEGNLASNSNGYIVENEEEPVEETEFSYFHGNEYDEITIPKRFGYVVEEKFIDRLISLNENDFRGLRKGQYMTSKLAETFDSEYHGIIEVIGMYDGQMMATSRSPGTGLAKTKPYYKIDDNTYVVLYFEDLYTILPLERIEVWDADGNKLRDIEIE